MADAEQGVPVAQREEVRAGTVLFLPGPAGVGTVEGPQVLPMEQVGAAGVAPAVPAMGQAGILVDVEEVVAPPPENGPVGIEGPADSFGCGEVIAGRARIGSHSSICYRCPPVERNGPAAASGVIPRYQDSGDRQVRTTECHPHSLWDGRGAPWGRPMQGHREQHGNHQGCPYGEGG